MLVPQASTIAQKNSELLRFIAIARDERDTRAANYAIRKILQHCQSRIDAAIWRYTKFGLKEEDLRSQSLVQLIDAIDTFDPTKGKRFENWLWWKLGTAFQKMLRAYNRDRISKAKALLNAEIATPESIFDLIDWEKAIRLISTFTDRLQDAIGLRFFHDLTWGEIAADLGGTANAIRMMVERAIEKIRKYLANLPANFDDPLPDCTFIRCIDSVGTRLFGWCKYQMLRFQRFRVRSRRRCVLTDQLPYQSQTMNRTQRFQLKRLRLILLGLIFAALPQVRALAQGPGDLGGTVGGSTCQAGPLTDIASGLVRISTVFGQSGFGDQACGIATMISVLIAIAFISLLGVGVINGLRSGEWNLAIIVVIVFIFVYGAITFISDAMLGSIPTTIIMG